MNMELVCSILQGIQKTMHHQLTMQSNSTLRPEDFKEKKQILIEEVQVLKKDIFTNTSIK